jgi:hypothetical protein
VTAVATKILDVSQLAQVVEAALIAGVGISLAFSLVIRGAVRAAEHRHERPFAAGLHALLATLAMLVCLGAIVFGVSTMLSK